MIRLSEYLRFYWRKKY